MKLTAGEQSFINIVLIRNEMRHMKIMTPYISSLVFCIYSIKARLDLPEPDRPVEHYKTVH